MICLLVHTPMERGHSHLPKFHDIQNQEEHILTVESEPWFFSPFVCPSSGAKSARFSLIHNN
jgi:hypothetical protein